MQLKKLSVELQEWGEQKGQYEIEITYLHERSETKLFLPTGVSQLLLDAVSSHIIKASQMTAQRLAESVPNNLLVSAPIEAKQIAEVAP